MAKFIWKSLVFSPAVLGAALVVSSAAIAAQTPAAKEVIQPQTVEALPELQPVAIATAPETPTVSPIPVISANAEKSELGQKVTATEAPEQLAVAPSQEPATADSAQALGVETIEGTSLPVMPAESKLAQTAPAGNTVGNNSVLEQINRYSQEGNNSQSQVTNVSQLSDVEPTDWAYEALRSLVERYGCIAGYPDGTYRGNRAMSRYEFAAGLNACLLQIEKLIAASTADFVTKEDLATLQRLIDEFGAELATLRTRVDNLEGRVTFLENHQFSTTTKLVGEAIFAVTDEFSDREDTNTIFGDRVRLDFQTSFTGRDVLHTRLAAGNTTPFLAKIPLQPDSSFEGNQTFDLNPGNNNDIILDWLAYEFPFGSSKVYLAAAGGIHADYAPVLNPYFYDGDGGTAALSSFAQQSPIYRIGGGAGIGIRLGVGTAPILGPTSLTVGYLADNGSLPGNDFGLFSGDYSALAQLNFTVNDRLGLAATYVHGYHNRGDGIFDLGGSPRSSPGARPITGTLGANDPTLATGTGARFPLVLDRDSPMSTNSYGLQAALRLSDRFSVSGFVGKTDISSVQNSTRGDVWYYGLGVAFPDLGKRGNILGIFAGVEPYLAGLEVQGSPVGIKNDLSYHLEGFYKYQLTDNISVTPGIIWITAPNQNDDNEDAVIGTLRTTFSF
ncbi:iron uptake porin [Coleofasciculus sp. FACHB-1120]|uniref:iron uptake porin n=1 Tax=Coleofasciculus sp. FACHB-1120 TaxID=2692783 RepID=UPI001682F0FA|nr:iron uptake porin [Coleofasciculus sp. FACHB-1120]MBD2742631.1 iron uptake porin [Coleofasciculus sp. FACHB-1120]